jgi:hypothetical protein
MLSIQDQIKAEARADIRADLRRRKEVEIYERTLEALRGALDGLESHPSKDTWVSTSQELAALIGKKIVKGMA